MSDTKTSATISEELKTAAAELRAVGGGAMAGPWESLNNGDRVVAWRNVPGTDFDDDFEYVVDEPMEKETAEWIALVNPLVAEPLAASMEQAAKEYEFFGANSESWASSTAASLLAVARVINGTTPQEVPARG
jgi:hypothetical protein